MKEVEIKAKLRDRDTVTQKLEKLGCVLEDMITQYDVVYAKDLGSLDTFLGNDVFLRIRTKNDGTMFFTLKKRMSNDLDAIEHECVISSKDEMEQALFLMGYQKAVEVKKQRVITKHNGCEICIDDVEGLGQFIEMEKLADDRDAEEIQEELFQFFETLGISREDRVVNGYDTLMLMRAS